jgi:hypothetical protein
MTSDRRSQRAEAEARVEETLAAIGAARRALAHGEQRLTGVHGFAWERKRLARLASQVQLAGNNLEDRREQLRPLSLEEPDDEEPDDAHD